MAGSFKDDSVATQQTITVSRKVMGYLKEILACFLPPHCPMPILYILRFQVAHSFACATHP